MAEKKKSTSSARPRRAATPAEAEITAAPAAFDAPLSADSAEVVKPKRAVRRREAAIVTEAIAVPVHTEPVATIDVDGPARRRPTHEEIARRAFEIFRERGGSAFDNWIAAERELRD